jgi:DNA polymerase elongation subunit (family B)
METFYRKRVKVSHGKDLKFQCVEWHTEDYQDPDNEEAESEYIIRCFGVTEEGKSVCCSITDFKPFFYIKVPGFFKKSHMLNEINKLKSKLISSCVVSLL